MAIVDCRGNSLTTCARQVDAWGAGSDAAAVIVEAHAYAYVYKAVAPKEMTGKNLIIPLRLGTETMGVLGMRILTAGSGSGGSRAMLLTEDAVITVSL